ncbi:uncharacterized protein EAE97_010154 [Botrytis byssoidea]|uniref:O-methyltransferase domain-containing protein n=1 Tax=Botrytis byssoidea TaxID=139641 RepID=A0A9P5HYE0_9HELO|nr:uncharacterized protein EAE97_010154 [Botrytis byssoidea]KAF7926645.1 hypothetical protein EAE97_010154 [Botrytis byssoidea]
MDLEITKQQNDAIRASIAEPTLTVEKHISACEENAVHNSTFNAATVTKTHVELMNAARKMKSDVYDQTDSIQQFIHSGCLRALLEAGVFDMLPLDGTGMPASELAEKTNMEEVLLIIMMRAVTPIYFEENTGGYEEYAPCSYALTPYFKENGFKEPDSIKNNPYTFAHRTNGLNMWEYLSLHPERLRIFNLGMNRISSQMWGGQGQAITAIKDIIEGTKGRLILQDREEVMLENPDPIHGIEKMTYNFFTPQPVKDCVAVLFNIANAMASTSRLLIAEMVLQDELDAEATWMDVTMMFFAGKERSEKQWRQLIEAVGLRLERIYGSEGTTFSVLEAWLK